MFLDGYVPKDLAGTDAAASRLEGEGYDALWIGESNHDPFLQLLVAARSTSLVTIGSSVAIAFARTPMTVAMAAHDLALLSEGRFILGLGTQVKAHVERRFSMPWSRPADRMREFVLALKAIWRCWQTGDKLAFEGDYYRHTLMTPFFTPESHEFGPPPVFLAAVGPRMCAVAGEVADGLITHPFTTASYLNDVTLASLCNGAARVGRGRAAIQVCSPVFVAVGRDEDELAAAVRSIRHQIAFYGSTPSYRGVLAHHGWGDLQTELAAMVREGRWQDLATVVPDDVLESFAVVGTPETVGRELAQRYSGIVDRIALHARYPSDDAIWPELIASFHSVGIQ